MQKKITFDSFIRGILTTIIIIGILYLIDILSGVLLPFFIAWLIAYMMYPCVNFVQNKLKFKNEDRILVGCFNPKYFSENEINTIKENENRYFKY